LQCDEILKVESKLRHLDSFSDDPERDAHVLYWFGSAHYYHCIVKDGSCFDQVIDRAIDYFERAKERNEEAEAGDRRETTQSFKAEIEMRLALLYSEGSDMEKAISSHRWFLANGNRHQVKAAYYVINLSDNFNRFNEHEYTIEVLEGSMDMMEIFEDGDKAQANLVRAYVECGEFLKAKATNKNCYEFLKANAANKKHHWMVDLQSGRIEEGLCNYKAAITHFRKAVAELQTQEYDDMSRVCCSFLARTLLKDSADNEVEAFAIFQEELDRCVDPLKREAFLFRMGTEYRKLHKWDQSIQSLRHLYLSATPQANEGMAQTYLEQYCTDTTLDIDQRRQILCYATEHSTQLDEFPTEMHLAQAQLFYFNGGKHEAYRHLELYLDDKLAYCKLSCYTCKQRVRHGSVPFSCASCMVASYCGRKHQKMTWKNERICHKVLCPLLGYWRVSKKKLKKRHELTNEDRHEYVTVFDTFFESICPHVELRASISSYTMIE
jgi:tetratricopeptide (TPR) repeat protein